MNKRELWETFMRTGRVSDYLKYKKAVERPVLNINEENLTEFSEDFFDSFPDEDN